MLPSFWKKAASHERLQPWPANKAFQQECSSMAERVLSIHKVLGSNLSAEKTCSLI